MGRYRLQGSFDQPVHVKLVLLDAMAESSQLNSGLPVVVILQVKIRCFVSCLDTPELKPPGSVERRDNQS